MSRCGDCAAPLGPGQGWCLECGARQPGAREPVRAPAEPEPVAETGSLPVRALPNPRVAAALVVGVLTLGIVIGGAAGGSGSLANTRQVVLLPPPATQPAAAPQADSAPSGGNQDLSAGGSSTSRERHGVEAVSSFGGNAATAPAPQEAPAPAPDTTQPDDTPAPAPSSGIKHVFTVVLAGASYDAAFGPASIAPYLANELAPQGVLLTQYSGLGVSSIAGFDALVSGQKPTDATRAGCAVYGGDCLFPAKTKTIADQVGDAGLSWKVYAGDLERGPDPAITACRHPAEGSPDDTTTERQGDGYALAHNPLVWFHSVLDGPDCGVRDVGLDSLEADLASADTAANWSLIVPNLCDGGWAVPCVDGRPGGLPQADAFLKQWVPKILDSPAYTDDGLLAIVFDDAPAGARDKRTGALLLSPLLDAGTTSDKPFDHYALLGDVEELLGLKRLAAAGDKRLPDLTALFHKGVTASSHRTHSLERRMPPAGTSQQAEDR